MSAVAVACAAGASLFGGIALAGAVMARGRRALRTRRRSSALQSQKTAGVAEAGIPPGDWVLAYADKLTRRLFMGATTPWVPAVRAGHALETWAGSWYKQRAPAAGCAKSITAAAFCEARVRLMAAGALAGALVGAVLSLELSVLLAVGLGVAGLCLPAAAVKRAIKRRVQGAELHLSEMLEIVALGLRSGLTFDRSFALYGKYFHNEFARSCTKAYRSWSLGLCSREEALREFAASYDSPQLSRIVDSIIRSLRFGSALAGILTEASSQARATYKAALEERVAKAPVKMMLPTGTLILPAMLLMILGPVLLELGGGF